MMSWPLFRLWPRDGLVMLSCKCAGAGVKAYQARPNSSNYPCFHMFLASGKLSRGSDKCCHGYIHANMAPDEASDRA